MTLNRPIGLLVVGCGDVFDLHYRPALEALSGQIRIGVLKAYASIADGRSHQTETTF